MPSGAFKEQQLFGDVDSTLAGGIAVLIFIVLLSAILFLLLWTVHRRRVQNPEDRPAIAFGKHPNVVRSKTFNTPEGVFEFHTPAGQRA